MQCQLLLTVLVICVCVVRYTALTSFWWITSSCVLKISHFILNWLHMLRSEFRGCRYWNMTVWQNKNTIYLLAFWVIFKFKPMEPIKWCWFAVCHFFSKLPQQQTLGRQTFLRHRNTMKTLINKKNEHFWGFNKLKYQTFLPSS